MTQRLCKDCGCWLGNNPDDTCDKCKFAKTEGLRVFRIVPSRTYQQVMDEVTANPYEQRGYAKSFEVNKLGEE